MRKGKIGGVVVAGIIVFVILFCIVGLEKIPTGYIGVVYNMNGGVMNETLGAGWHIVSPAKKVKEFTISNEQLVLSKDKREGSKGNDSFLVSTSDNANIRISFQMSYRYLPEKVVDTYKKYRGLSGEDIVNNRVKTVLKSKISEATSKYTMMEIYSGNRGQINTEITKLLNEKLTSDFGIEVFDASIIDVHPDNQLEKAINERVTAMQKKQQAEAEQEAIKVEAATKIIQADNAAAIKMKEAQAEADANRLVSGSITEELIRMKEADARLKHGWVTVQTGGDVIADTGK